MQLKKFYLLIVIMLGVIYTWAMVMPYNAAAITTLENLESESIALGKNTPHLNSGDSPEALAVNEGDNKVYVANSGSNDVSIIDGETLKVSTLGVGESPRNIVIDDFNNIVYVANYDSDSVSIIDGETLKVSTIAVGGRPNNIALTDDIAAYVANSGTNTITAINGTDYTSIANISVGEQPEGIDVWSCLGIGCPRDNIAYVANSGTNTITAINGTDYTSIANISVGEIPGSIAVDDDDNIVYVANYGSDTVSIINGTDYTNIANISVGESPQSIAVNENGNIVYVTNYLSNTVSIIDGTNYTGIANVTVGEGPRSIVFDDRNNIAYVANTHTNTVSIINGTDYRVANITVGASPQSIAVDGLNDLVYVANYDSDSVSVISGKNQQVQAGVSFDVNPFHAGHVECNEIAVPTNQYFYVDFRTQCTAQANKGFQFSSWNENLGSNSSRSISTSQGDWFTNALSALSAEPSPATLTVTNFGNFTANFEKLPPAIPSEYLATLFTVVVTAFVGSWLTPSFIGWRKTRKQEKRLDYYHIRLKHLYDNGRLDKNDIDHLDELRNSITDEYTRGKINKEQFDKLADDISISYREIFKKEIDSINYQPEKDKELSKIKENIQDAFAKRKLGDQHYNLLNNRIESFVNPNNNKTNDNK